ncbi:leucine zipper domain-containing protein [Isoptericola sp. b515]|uniref:helix-turn-helix domain-containing protein n=1 Tax=Isoptericola sp. b515 TaxID=3064652 RepID=UPI0035171894
MSHANARLTPAGRLTMVRRIAAGRPVAHVAAVLGVSRTTAWRRWRRYQEQRRAAVMDRSSRPHSCPHRTSARVEAGIRTWRHLARRGPVDLARRVGVRASRAGLRPLPMNRRVAP